MKLKMPSQTVRAYLYRLAVAAGGVAVFYGYMSADEVAVWGGFLTVALMALPATNTPVARGRHAKPD